MTAEDHPGAAPARLGHQPALDGLRGVAVTAVLLFHAGFGWASGGYLGVSVFFTLSGFLITRLLLDEHRARGRIDLRRFYARRVRRLVPASALTLLAVVGLARAGAFAEVVGLRRDLVGASLQVANWSQLTSGRSYADLFTAGSPVDHMWSLAVEEQVYVLWPLVLIALCRRPGRDGRTVRSGVVVAFLLAAVAAPVIAAVGGGQAAYLATPARLAEVLAGAVLAVGPDVGRRVGWWRWAGVAAAVLGVVLVVATPADGGWPYAGGLPLFAVLSAAMVASALVAGPVRTALGWRPLVVLGTISYGVYLVHWPIFLLVDAREPDLDRVPGFALKVVLTLGVALLSYALVEHPIRTGRPRPATVPLGLGATAVVAVAALVVAPPGAPRPAVVDRAAAERVAIEPVVGGSADGATTAPVDARPVRIMVVGDSTGDVIGAGLVAWAAADPDRAQVDVRTLAGCGLVTGGRYDSIADTNRERCEEIVHHEVPAAYPVLRPDVVVVSITLADTWDRRWDDGPVLRPTDPAYAARIEEAYAGFFATAAAAGVPHVVWLRPPVSGGLEGQPPDPSFSDGSQEIVEAAVGRAVERHPGVVSVLDYRTWFEGTALADRDTRPDGVHLTAPAAEQVATDLLGPRLTEIAGAA